MTRFSKSLIRPRLTSSFVGAAIVLSLISNANAAPASDADWLILAAQKTEDKALRATLLRGAVQLDATPQIIFQLGQALEAAELLGEATAQYEKVILHKDASWNLKNDAGNGIARIRTNKNYESTSELRREAYSRTEAVKAFNIGRKHALAKRTSAAIRYFHAALALDPTLPGSHRFLGMLHTQAGRDTDADSHLAQYLSLRPTGPLAARIRERLSSRNLLGTVEMSASYPCQIWVNGYPMGAKTPQQISLPSGNHTISFLSPEYHIEKTFQVSIIPRKKEQLVFRFGLLESKLEPWARIRANGRDLGLWEQVGLPAGSYTLSIVSHDRSQRAEVPVVIDAGKQIVLSDWKNLPSVASR